VRIIAKRTLSEFWERYASAEGPLRDWHYKLRKLDLDTPAQIKEHFPDASILPNNRVVFSIKHNDYRLVVRVFYPGSVVYVRFVGTHAEYDRINAEEV
jgi:mRNA interferase HigB